jgi:hypothetical protein
LPSAQRAAFQAAARAPEHLASLPGPDELELTADLASTRIHTRQKSRCHTRIMTESLFVHDRLSGEQLIIEVRQLAGPFVCQIVLALQI